MRRTAFGARVMSGVACAVSGFLASGCSTDKATAPMPATSQKRAPNIVMVLVDDMRWDEMHAVGHPFIETPNMDRLAREGALFRNAAAFGAAGIVLSARCADPLRRQNLNDGAQALVRFDGNDGGAFGLQNRGYGHASQPLTRPP